MIRTSCWPILLDYSISSNLPTITVTRVASLTKQSSESDAAVMSPSGHAIEDFNGLNPISLTRLVAKEPLLRLHQRLQLRVWQQRRCYLLSPSHPCAPWEVYNSLKISSTDAIGNACWESQDRRICTFLFLRTRREPHYFYEMSLEVIKPFAAFYLCSVSRQILQQQVWWLQIGWLILRNALSRNCTISCALTFLLRQRHDCALSSSTLGHALLH